LSGGVSCVGSGYGSRLIASVVNRCPQYRPKTPPVLATQGPAVSGRSRTGDLLHGKQNLIRRCTLLFACKLVLFDPEEPQTACPSIRADSGGFSEPFPLGRRWAGPSAYRAETSQFDPSARRRSLGTLRISSAGVRLSCVPATDPGGRPVSDLGPDLGAVALARGLKLAGDEAITTYCDGQPADGERAL
jgi:hypothetical protein